MWFLRVPLGPQLEKLEGTLDKLGAEGLSLPYGVGNDCCFGPKGTHQVLKLSPSEDGTHGH